MYPRIYAIGDSHCLVFGTIDLVFTCKTLGPVTMYRAGQGKVHFKSAFYDESIVVFCFGEIDVRAHVWKQIQLGRNEDEVINKLATDYINELKKHTSYYKIIVSSITPPINAAESEDPELPIRGSREQRARYTKKLNGKLKVLCAENNLLFLDSYNDYADKNGLLRKELSDGSHHIGNATRLRQRLSELVGRK